MADETGQERRVAVRGSTTGRPLMAAMDLLGRRWALRILWELRDGPVGARALRQRCDGMSSSVLYDRLRELTSAALIEQTDTDAYALTETGAALGHALRPLDDWAVAWKEGRVAGSDAVTIVPDDKDWTWVLERPCPECGFDAEQVALPDVPATIRGLVGPWQRVLLRGDVADRPSPDRWSPLEYACHVRDVFRIFDGRLQLMMDDDGTTFANWDQDATAVEERYDLQDPARVSVELADAGEALAARFSRVTGPQWGHRGLRSNGSEFTVATFAVYLLHDPVHHLWDVDGA